jgi:hypothetical protein
MATIITNIDPTTLEVQNYSPQDINLIPIEETPSQFNPFENYVEYTIQSIDQSFQVTDQNFIDFKVINDYSPTNSPVIYSVNFDPEINLLDRGFSNGEYNTIYNFLNNELGSTFENRAYYIKDISADRTEIRISSNILSNSSLESYVSAFKNKLDNAAYFQDFYLNFGSNQLIIANNILVDNTKSNYEILINLYEALPNQFRLKDTLWVVTRVADPLAFNIQFQPEVIIPQITNPTIKGPNFDLPLKDRINNSSNYINYAELLTTGLASSQQQILSYLQDTSIAIGVDYSDFSEFIHFSSAKSRIQNFYYKVQLLEQYNSDITTLGTSTSSSISSSISILQDKVDNIIKNFDGYEYWLYFETGSTTYPKGTTVPPYSLLYSEDPTVITWYNNLIESASIYDQNNQDYLVNTIPDYLRDDPQNEPYKVFIDMIGQHYDNIWLYYKDVTNRYNGDNRLDFGISKDLVADALRSFGLKIYQNNFSTSDLYNAFTGFNYLPSGSDNLANIDNGNVYTVTPYIVEPLTEGVYGYFTDDLNYTPATTELITNYITASQDALYEPIDDINKEIYKRLYHNLPLLLKQKGTVAGLRNLINVYGIPDTILRINEFGGRDKDTSTYDYFYQKFNYKWNTLQAGTIQTNWSLDSAWPTSSYNTGPVPEVIQFRFQTDGLIDNPSFISPLLTIDGSTDFPSVILRYTGSAYTSGSYDGSIIDPEYQYAYLEFIPSPITRPEQSASIYLPFFNKNWWSVMVTWNSTNNFTLYAGSKGTYDGYDGNQIEFLASASVTSTSGNVWGTQTAPLRLGVITSYWTPDQFFSGSYQELRYYSKNVVSVDSFKNYIMNPNSIDTTGEIDYADYLAFRASLGAELDNLRIGGDIVSIHPKVTGSWITTGSFDGGDSQYEIGGGGAFQPNIESVFFNGPATGLRDRMTDKIQIVSQSLPQINLQYTQSGNTLSQYISIQQQYASEQSEIPDVNALEVAFSPQNEIDDDIIDSLGYFNIGEYIGDPRQVSSSATSYPDLNTLAVDYFQKYYDRYDLFDYIRLIKFFDNSLFKMIKDFVPARTNLRSGVVVKQHILERNKYPQPMMDTYQVQNTNVYSSSAGLYEIFNYAQDLTLTGSIDTAFFNGSTGGTFNEFNIISPNDINGNIALTPSKLVSTDYSNIFKTVSGFLPIVFGILSDYRAYENYFTLDVTNGTITSNIQGTLYFTFSSDLTSPSTPVTYYFKIISSINGVIYETSYTTSTTPDTFNFTSSLISTIPGEIFEAQVKQSGGSFNQLANTYLNGQIITINNQVWPEFELGPSGSTYLIREDQREFYNGELPGTTIEASNGELNEANVFKYPSTLEINYNTVFYKSNITTFENFININTSPNQGEIYLWYDTGSILNPEPISGLTPG